MHEDLTILSRWGSRLRFLTVFQIDSAIVNWRNSNDVNGECWFEARAVLDSKFWGPGPGVSLPFPLSPLLPSLPLLTSLPAFPLLLSSFPFYPSLVPFLSHPLEVDPLNPARGLGSTLSFSSGSGAEPQPKMNLVHFRPTTWHLVATNLMIYLIIKWPNFMQIWKHVNSAQLRIAIASKIVTGQYDLHFYSIWMFNQMFSKSALYIFV